MGLGKDQGKSWMDPKSNADILFLHSLFRLFDVWNDLTIFQKNETLRVQQLRNDKA